MALARELRNSVNRSKKEWTVTRGYDLSSVDGNNNQRMAICPDGEKRIVRVTETGSARINAGGKTITGRIARGTYRDGKFLTGGRGTAFIPSSGKHSAAVLPKPAEGDEI
jgi:hypothetical protein